jgi:hypothetical protein
MLRVREACVAEDEDAVLVEDEQEAVLYNLWEIVPLPLQL